MLFFQSSIQSYVTLEMPGWAWPNWLYKTTEAIWDLECLNNCKIDNATCSFVHFESSTGTCYLGKLGFWYGAYPTLARVDATGLADFGKNKRVVVLSIENNAN